MKEHKFLTTAAGVKMPWIIYGTAWKKERTLDLVVKAVQNGFQGIDTACQPKHYDEPLVGAALQRLDEYGIRRQALFVQTKFTPLDGQDPRRVPYARNASLASQVTQSFEVSTKNLQTDYVDSLVLHSPLFPHTLLMEAWTAMEAIQKTGGARQLGISNCYSTEVLAQLYADANVKPAVVQNRFYQQTGYDSDLRKWCAHHGIIYQSFWTLTANPHILNSETIKNISQHHQKTKAQTFFRFLNQSGIVPLTGTSSEQHMQEDLDVFDFELAADELKTIKQMIEK